MRLSGTRATDPHELGQVHKDDLCELQVGSAGFFLCRLSLRALADTMFRGEFLLVSWIYLGCFLMDYL